VKYPYFYPFSTDSVRRDVSSETLLEPMSYSVRQTPSEDGVLL
jgi:hypothetical protein